MLPMVPEAVFSETPRTGAAGTAQPLRSQTRGTDQIRWPPLGMTSLGWGGYRIECGGSAQGDQCPGVVAG